MVSSTPLLAVAERLVAAPTLAGALADGPGARAGFLVCLAGALLALAATALGRRTLVAQPATA